MSPRDPKYVENDFMWAQNRSKWAQMGVPK